MTPTFGTPVLIHCPELPRYDGRVGRVIESGDDVCVVHFGGMDTKMFDESEVAEAPAGMAVGERYRPRF